MKKAEKIKVVKPGVVIETITTGKEKKEIAPKTVFRKIQILTAIPLSEGHIRCEVLKDYKGMTDDLYEGDIIDLPERRFKSLSFRGLVKVYEGKDYPNKQR
jgi:hypothetical protein